MFLTVNGQAHAVAETWRGESLLFVLREHLGLTGTKYGCGQGACGACTVILDGEAVRSCQIGARDAVQAQIRTIEGLGSATAPHSLQRAWVAIGVPQCGYCQSGQIMGAAALLARNPDPSDAEIIEALAGHLCRCGTYDRIRRAVHLAATGEA